MKKWLNFFFLSFFSHKTAKEGTRRGYSNTFLAFVLALVFLWIGFFSADMMPFGTHYNNSPDFRATAYAVLANADADKRIDAVIENGSLKVRKQGGEFAEILLVNTFESEADRQCYSVNGYNIVVDSRPADTPAKIKAYCVSNDGKETVISYTDYLTLSEVARLNFDFKIEYTGEELALTDESVKEYRLYVEGLGGEKKERADDLSNDLSEGKITKDYYNRAIYELYFESYYPPITAYESSSKIPLLRNYYYHKYVSQGVDKYLMIFDDYMTGSFETKGGVDVSFYGFYSGIGDGRLIAEGATESEARTKADSFIQSSFKSIGFLTGYAHFMNVLTLTPFMALMLMVAALLTYSILKLRSVESITTIGAMLKIVGSFVWFAGAVSAVITVITAFFVKPSLLNTLPLVLFFVVLVIRSVVFAIQEIRLFAKQSEQREAEQTEV